MPRNAVTRPLILLLHNCRLPYVNRPEAVAIPAGCTWRTACTIAMTIAAANPCPSMSPMKTHQRLGVVGASARPSWLVERKAVVEIAARAAQRLVTRRDFQSGDPWQRYREQRPLEFAHLPRVTVNLLVGARQFTGEDLVLQQRANQRRPLDGLLQVRNGELLGGLLQPNRPRHGQTVACHRDCHERRILAERITEERVALPIHVL